MAAAHKKTTTPAPRITNPMVKTILARPCRLCGSADHTNFPEIAVEHAAGASSCFEMVVCRNCQCVDWFIPKRENGFNLDTLEKTRTHRIYRAPPTTPYRG